MGVFTKGIATLLLAAMPLLAMEPLVDGRWLKAHLGEKDLVVIDLSSKALYTKEHIPGALHSDISKWRERHGKYALVRSIGEIETHMRALGIGNSSRVVIYSHHSGGKDTLKPAYVVWAMALYGMENTAILDGGLPGWKAAGGKVDALPVKRREGDFKGRFNPEIVVDLEGVRARLGKVAMLDARPAAFYFGAKKQKVLERAGHIAGATSYFWRYSFDDDGTLKPKSELTAMLVEGLGLDPKREVVTYCTGGLETSMNFFVLRRILGFEKVRLYDASMREWANREDTLMRRFRWE